MNDGVTICIPAFNAADFIDRTLNCARAQTHSSIRIRVSVDHSEDATAELCLRHARQDRRVSVIRQPSPLGWSRNTNAALAAVETDYFFLYFHDDIIEPTYVEKLLDVLEARPDAASVHCDLEEFGLAEGIRRAHAYEGSAARRLAEFLLTQQGTTLRSLVRRSKLPRPLRFPAVPGDNRWGVYPFHLELLAAGPALAWHETLYRRWNRNGSLTRSAHWTRANVDDCLQSQRVGARHCLAALDRVPATSAEREATLVAMASFFLRFARREQLRARDPRALSAADITDRFPVDLADSLAGLDPDADLLAMFEPVCAELRQLDDELERLRSEGRAD